MSVIQKIQEKGAWIIFILIALALIAFIMMDSSFSRGNLFSNTTVVGKVNGEKILKSDFDAKLDMIQQMQGQQAPPREQMIGQVWDYMVQLTTLHQQFATLGLGYSSKELDNALFGNNPPQFMRQQFSDPKTGMYNADAARQAFAQLKKQKGPNQQVDMFFNAYIQPLIDQSLAQKYQTLISGATYIPTWLADKTTADNNSVASFNYVSVPYSSIPDKDVTVSDAEIEAYVQKHPKQFTQKTDTRTISYVAFNAAASVADSAAIKASLESLKPAFAAAANLPSFLASKSSNVPYYDGFVADKEIKDPFKAAIVASGVGNIYGPYVDGSNFVLARLVATATIADTAKVRHILVATTQQDPQSGQSVPVRDDSAALKRLDSAIALINKGASFDSIAAIYSDDPGSKTEGGVIDNITSGKMVPEFNNFAFTGHVGEKKTIHTNFGYHYVEILSQKGSEAGYKIAHIAKPIEPSANTINLADNSAAQFAAASQDAASFKSNAQKSKLTVVDLPNIHPADFQVGNLGNSREFVKWIYSNKIGKVSAPTQVGNFYVVGLVTGIQKAGLENAATARAIVEPILRNEKKAQIIIASKFKGNTLQSFAQSAQTQILKADSVSFAAPFIQGIGNEPKVIGAAFNKSMLNKTTAPLAGTTGVFAIQPISITGVAGMGAAQVRQGLKQQLLQQINYRSLSALTDAANVKDNRADFY